MPSSPSIALNRTLSEHATVLGRHLLHCRAARGRWFPAAVIAERVHELMAPRFVTTVSIAVVLIAAACGWI